MGFSHSWVAVKGLTAEQALATLRMEVSEVLAPDEIRDWRDIVVMGVFREDWLLVLSADMDDAFEGNLAQLVAFGPAIACAFDENSASASAHGYANGEEIWGAVHDPEQGEGEDALEISGTPPPELAAVMRTARAEQRKAGVEDADVDLGEIANDLSKAICGYKPGDDEPDGFRYSTLRPIGGKSSQPGAGERRGFLARLFGRG